MGKNLKRSREAEGKHAPAEDPTVDKMIEDEDEDEDGEVSPWLNLALKRTIHQVFR